LTWLRLIDYCPLVTIVFRRAPDERKENAMEIRRASVWMLTIALGVCQLGASGGGAGALAKGGVWAMATAMPEPRQESAVGVLGNMIYVIGGYGADGVPSTLVQVFDAAANKWQQAAPMPEGLHHHGVAAADGKIYVVGGFTGVFAKRVPIASVWQYDPAADRWDKRAPLPTVRGALAIAVLDGKIYALGGERFSAAKPGTYEPVADAAVYDPKTDAWEILPPLRYRRDHLHAGAIGGRVYAVAGRDRPDYTLRRIEEYNPATRAWTERALMPTGRSGGTAAVVNNRIYVFGGEGNAENTSMGTFNQVEFYDPARDTWTDLAPMPLPRHAFGAAVVGNRIYLPGGSIVQGGRAPGTTPIMDTFEPN
jgi:N-acetylneuraminic acid mutarotase